MGTIYGTRIALCTKVAKIFFLCKSTVTPERAIYNYSDNSNDQPLVYSQVYSRVFEINGERLCAGNKY